MNNAVLPDAFAQAISDQKVVDDAGGNFLNRAESTSSSSLDTTRVKKYTEVDENECRDKSFALLSELDSSRRWEDIDLEDIDPDDVDPEDVDPEDVDYEESDPKYVDPEDVDPEDVDREDVDPEDVDREGVDPEDVDPEDVDPEDVDPMMLILRC